MSDTAARLVALAAAAMAAAALVVSVTHHGPAGPAGPRGPQGPQGSAGQAGKAATVAHLGLCWNFNTWSAGGGSVTTNTLLTSPVLTDGVPSCPNGQFVSIVPGG